jgi:predicted  nucleic acid-binding Zn-ribbon protein
MNPVAQLFNLQKTDIDLDRIENRFQQLEAEINADQSVKNAEQKLLKAKNKQVVLSQALRTIEENVKHIQIKIEITDKKLYSGSIKAPKELQDLQTELTMNKSKLKSLEEDELQAMIDCEQHEIDFKQCEENLSAIRAESTVKHSLALGEKCQLSQEKDRLLRERNAIQSSIPNDIIELYLRLKKNKHGLAVSIIADNNCERCGASITPAMVQTVRSMKEIVQCPSCGRILYAG